MANEVAPLQTVQENIKAKIKAEFVNLIPDEMWTAMVESVVNEFINDKTERNYGGDFKTTPSPLKQMIRAEIEALAKGILKAELDRLTAGAWNDFGQNVATEALKKLIAGSLPDIVAAMQAGMVEIAVTATVNHMRNSMNRF